MYKIEVDNTISEEAVAKKKEAKINEGKDLHEQRNDPNWSYLKNGKI